MSIVNARDSAANDFTKKYHVIAKLGEGGMALVHLAVVRGVAGVRKLVVLKSVRPELVSDAHVREMFLAEARLTAGLNHPNIVQTFEVVVFGGRPVLVMEYLDGQPLSRVLHRDRAPMPLPLRLFVLKEILSGLDYVHTFADLDGTPLNLVHRDVSPQNIFITYDGQPKLLDFGIAKSVMTTSQTEAGIIKGKIRYMAPEQILGSAHLDRRADLFAVGVMLWEAITGRRMWEGVPDVQVMQTLVNGSLPDPASVTPDVPPALAEVCRKAIAREREGRYESAAAMHAELEAAIRQLGLEANARQVGRFVNETFSELRSAIRKIVEGQLKTEEAAPINLVVSEDNDAIAAESDAAITADLWGLPSALSVGGSQSGAARRRQKRRVVLAGSAIVVAGAIGSIGYVRFQDGARHDAPTAAAAPVLPPAAPAPVPTSVHVHVEASPSTASIFLDDTLLPSNPFDGEVPKDAARHVIRAEARGYRADSRPVDLSKPLELVLGLEPMPSAAPAPPPVAPPYVDTRRHGGSRAPFVAAIPSTPSGGASPGQAAASPPSTISCNPPFYFDESGIKRIKPECLK